MCICHRQGTGDRPMSWLALCTGVWASQRHHILWKPPHSTGNDFQKLHPASPSSTKRSLDPTRVPCFCDFGEGFNDLVTSSVSGTL